MDREQFPPLKFYIPKVKRKMGRAGMKAKPTRQGEMRETGITRGMIERRKEMQRRMRTTPGMLTGGQAKIAAKAPPTNKIDAKDFAVLRAEKAKGRGQGLQDEKIKPGKVMKADKGGMGEAKGYKKYLQGLKKAEGSVFRAKYKAKQLATAGGKAALRAAKASRVGKIAAGVAGAALLGKAALEKMYEKRTGKKPFTKRPAKKMGGGMMKKPMGYSKGMLFTMDDIIENMGRDYDYQTRIKFRKKSKEAPDQDSMDAYSEAEQDALKSVKKKYTGKMGGGMMMRPNPVGYKKGVLVKTKIGKNKPTKMY